MTKSEDFSPEKNNSIACRRTGTGPVVLLIHGFGEDQHVWDTLVPELEKANTLLIPDLPGTGSSPAISDMSIDGIADSLLSIFPKEPITVIGHSMGGYIALALLEKYPDRLNSLGLLHSTSYADTEEKKASRRKGIEFINQHGAFEFLKTSIPNLFSPLSKQKMAEGIHNFIQQQRNLTAETLVSYYEAMIGRPDRRQLLKNTDKPILFIMGKYDVAVPFSDGLAQCHLPGISYIHILRRSGHMGMMEEAETVKIAMKNFLFQVQSHQ